MLVAPPPVQLTFDRFVVWPGNQVANNVATQIVGRRWPAYRLLTLRGFAGVGKSLLLQIMGSECSRLWADAKVEACTASELVAAVQERHAFADLLLVDEAHVPIKPHARSSIVKLVGERAEAGRITVLAFDLRTETNALLRACMRDLSQSISVEMAPPDLDSRREIMVRYLKTCGVVVEEDASASVAFVPWETDEDVRYFAALLIEAAFPVGRVLTASAVRRLALAMGRRGVGGGAAQVAACCSRRIDCAPAPGRWPADDENREPTTIRTATFKNFCRTVEMRVRVWSDRLWLQLRSDHKAESPSRYEIDLRTAPSVSLRTRCRGPWRSTSWGLAAGLTRTRHDPFRRACTWIYRVLVALDSEEPWRKLRELPPSLRETLGRATGELREAARLAAAVLPQSARKTAMRFPAHMRLWLCRKLAADTSGRLAQLSITCPGALTFGYALVAYYRAQTGRAGNSLLRDAIAGRPLNDLLDDAVNAWAAGAEYLVDRGNSQNLEAEGAWRRVMVSAGREREAIVRVQRLLVRRAGAGVPGRTLWLPPPAAFAPEDIPTRKLENARWFKTMKSHPALLGFSPRTAPPNLPALCAFLSRHALVIEASDEVGHGRRMKMQRIIDYVAAVGACPRRTSSPQQLLDAVVDWHERMARAEDLATAAAHAGQPIFDEQGRALVLREPPCPGWRDDKDVITPLRTAEDVVSEGRRMHNCVVSRIPRVVQGTAALYHGEVGGSGLTIQIVSSLFGWRLFEVEAFGAQAPSAGARQVLRRWLNHFATSEGGRCPCGRAKP
jgi:hypothetical protein